MSVTESKAKTERKSSRKAAKTQETALSALLAQTEEVSVPLASLIKSPLNVRSVPYSALTDLGLEGDVQAEKKILG
ncbi:hypothetical protein O5264_29860, partial [Escherichia coli]|nr:hypothetical protein [Escherichia coli]